MDLEVSEPIDFGSGDHQHLVRKAADHNPQTKPSQSYQTSPSPESKNPHENLHMKTSERTNVYVVQISEDTTPEDSSSHPFSNSDVRRDFIIKVFLILSAQLMITGTITSTFIFWKTLRTWVCANAWFTYALFYYEANEVLWATAATALVTLLLTLFALQTKWDFTLLNGALFVLLCVLIIYGILLLFIQSYWLHLIYAGLGTVLFSLYLVMDIQLMVGGRHHHSDLNPEEYIFAALNIYLDIINLFLFILQLIGLG
ncbi:Protein lifeguard 2, partial [Galemys pyrenaicus]